MKGTITDIVIVDINNVPVEDDSFLSGSEFHRYRFTFKPTPDHTIHIYNGIIYVFSSNGRSVEGKEFVFLQDANIEFEYHGDWKKKMSMDISLFDLFERNPDYKQISNEFILSLHEIMGALFNEYNDGEYEYDNDIYGDRMVKAFVELLNNNPHVEKQFFIVYEYCLDIITKNCSTIERILESIE